MRTAWYPTTLVFVFTALLAQQISLGADAPRFLFGPATPVSELNMPGDGDWQLSLTPDGLEAFFARTNFDSENLSTSSVLYTSRRTSTSEPFGRPRSIAELAPPNTYGDTGPSISADGLTLYFGRGPTPASMPLEEERIPFRGVFAATRPSRDAAFGPPTEITGLKLLGDPGSFGRPRDLRRRSVSLLPVLPSEPTRFRRLRLPPARCERSLGAG